MKNIRNYIIPFLLLVSITLIAAAPLMQIEDPDPPDQVTKLIFIHHSTGENWLADENGNLGRRLAENNYFVSDTNYGWGPDVIGDRTDIPDWMEWFRSEETSNYMNALLNESGQNSEYSRLLSDPEGENQIVVFMSGFPNAELAGNPDDPPGKTTEMTVSGAKYVYNHILDYFASRPDKLFIVITAPPVSDSTCAANARDFNDWLVKEWLREYPYNNVAVFDFHAVLTGPNNRHRVVNGQIEHVTEPGMNTLYYPSDDDHPAMRGNQKATGQFIPMLNLYYHRWQANAPFGSSALVPEPVFEPEDEVGDRPFPCIGSLTLPLGMVGLVYWQKKKSF